MKPLSVRWTRRRATAPPPPARSRTPRRRFRALAVSRMASIAVFVIAATALPAGPISGQEAAAVDPPAPPTECVTPSRVGEVVFPHRIHVEDFELECVVCHHEVDAKSLDTPHEEYFDDFWIRCGECHHDQTSVNEVRSCSACHHASSDIADQTLSAKVVIHRSCSQCHEIGTGAEAGASCTACHSGPKRAW